MNIGDIIIDPVRDGTSFLPADYFGIEGTPGHELMYDENGRWHMPIGGFIIRTGGRTILLDGGLGPMDIQYEHAPGVRNHLIGGQLPASLAQLNVRPEDIDTILLSHLHADHSGWVLQNGQPYFPNATVKVGRADWELFVDREVPQVDVDGFRRLAQSGRVEFIDADGPVAPGIDSVHTPGHTPGHQAYVVSSGNERGVFLGDAIACPVQIEAPELECLADVDRRLGVRTREQILRELSGDELLGGAHFPELNFGRLVRTEKLTTWMS